MLKNNNLKTIFLKTLGILLSCVCAGTLLLTLIYSIPTERIMNNIESSRVTFEEQNITQWAGWTRYSHLSNSTDFTMIDEAMCRYYDSNFLNAMLNPRYIDGDNNLVLDKTNTIEIFPRYWHGYLTYIIPLLCITNAGGIRTILMILELFLFTLVALELSKHNKAYSLMFLFSVLFINPITSALSYQNADIYIISMVFSLILLRNNTWLSNNKKFYYLFLLNGIFVAYFDFLTYPLVAWGFPVIFAILISNDNIKESTKKIIIASIAWIIGYAGMWAGKWILASLFTDVNVISDALMQAQYRISGDGYSYLEVLNIIFESVNDVPMMILLSLSIFTVLILAIKNNRKKIHLNINSDIIPFVLISLSPFAWYFVMRNHSYIHPWFEYRELAVAYLAILAIIYKLFTYHND